VVSIYYAPAHPYTQALLRSIPRHDARLDRLETIEGNVPDPTNMPAGCKFHPRCQHYIPSVCGSPELVQVGEQHWARCARVHDLRPQPSHTEHAS